MGFNPVRQSSGECHMLANVMADSLGTVGTENEPQLQGPEPAAERNVPIPVVDDFSRFRCLVPQIRGQDAQRFDERLAVGNVEE